MRTLNFTPVSQAVATAPQLEPADMAAVAHAGFRSVVNNRPDREGGPEQPSSETLRQAAAALGLEYEHLPVNSAHIRPQDVRRFAELLDRLPKPVLAFCRTGTRSRKLHDAARSIWEGPGA